uniref:Uncharacterized protein n=1 Tax=Rhipicephalus zambeziensis TaxID=60191 RepID=A0A224Z1V6_9ACAR
MLVCFAVVLGPRKASSSCLTHRISRSSPPLHSILFRSKRSKFLVSADVGTSRGGSSSPSSPPSPIYVSGRLNDFGDLALL